LYRIYKSADTYDRLYFYFAGHGLLAPADAARGVMHTAIIPSDVRDLEVDADKLIDVIELVQYFQFAGPREQFFIIDACRDLRFDKDPPNLPRISWSAEPQDARQRAQAILWAVAPRGRAAGIKDGLGFMSRHLVRGLGGAAAALDWSDELQSRVVTPSSVHRYVRLMVLKDLVGEQLWQRYYMTPLLESQGAEGCVLLQVDDPGQLDLTVQIEPAEAAVSTEVWLTLRGNRLYEPTWPPHLSSEAVQVPPDRYRVRAQCRSAGTLVTSDPEIIDVRERSDVVVRVGPPTGDWPDRPIEPGPGIARSVPGHPQVFRAIPGLPELGPLPAPPADANLTLTAQERLAVADVEALDPPYTSLVDEKLPWQGRLEPGTYQVRFRLGNEVFSQTIVELKPGQIAQIEASAAVSPLVEDTVGWQGPGQSVFISESMGPLQANILPTMLAVMGIKAFDQSGELFHQFTGVIEPRSPEEFGDRPLSLVVAIEGATWPVAVQDVGGMIAAEMVDGTTKQIPLWTIRSHRTSAGVMLTGLTAAPPGPFSVRLTSPLIGQLTIASASLPGRATVITAVLRPDGSSEIGQHIMRLPGRIYREPVVDIPYGRLLRELQLGQQLYQGGELYDLGTGNRGEFLNGVLNAKWTDPILGCMAYYALADEASRSEDPEPLLARRQLVARNLLQYFPELPDVRIIARLELIPDAPSAAEPSGRVETVQMPVLARSVREAALMDRDRGSNVRPDNWLLSWLARWLPDVSRRLNRTGPLEQAASRLHPNSPFNVQIQYLLPAKGPAPPAMLPASRATAAMDE
jgi:Caspase domain